MQTLKIVKIIRSKLDMPKSKKNRNKQQKKHHQPSIKVAELKSCLKEVPKVYKNTKKENDKMDKLCNALFSLTRRKLSRNKIPVYVITIYDGFMACDQTKFLYYFGDEMVRAFTVCLKSNKIDEVLRLIPMVALKLFKNEKAADEAVELVEMLKNTLRNVNACQVTKVNCAKCLCVVLYVLNDDMQEIYNFMDELICLTENIDNFECTADFLKCFGFLLTVIPKSAVLQFSKKFLSVISQMLENELDIYLTLEIGIIVSFMFEENYQNIVNQEIDVTNLKKKLQKHAFSNNESFDDDELFRLLLRTIEGREFKIRTETILEEKVNIYSLKYQIRFLFFQDLFLDLDIFHFYYRNSYLLKELLHENPSILLNKTKEGQSDTLIEQMFAEKIKAEEKLEDNEPCCKHITFNDRTFVKEFCESDYECDSS